MEQSEQRSPWGRRIGCLILGCLIALGHAPVYIPFFMILIVPFIIWHGVNQDDPKSAFGIGYWTGLGYFAVSLNWIVEPFLVEPELFGWMAPFGILFMAGGLALFWGAPFALATKLGKANSRRIILLVCLWALSEFLRGHIFTGFPWALLAYLWVGTGVSQVASVLGAYGLGFLTLGILAIPALMPQDVWKGAAWSGALLAVLWGWGEWRIPNTIQMADNPTKVRLVQPNAPQHLKWRADMIPVFYRKAVSYTAARTRTPPDIVIWPETALPFALGENPKAMQAVADAAGPQTDVLVGIRRRKDDGGFNSAVYLDHFGGVLSVYDKHHLVPFGEYLPFNKLFNAVGLHAIADNIGGYFKGEGPKIIKGNKVPDFLPLICYEVIFPEYGHSDGSRPAWLVQLTNDAWFGAFSGPYQHLAIARMRAIEQGLPLARAANTGISAMIDPYGRVTHSLALNQSGYIDTALPAVAKATWFGFWREWFWAVCAVGILITTLLPQCALFTRNRQDLD